MQLTKWRASELVRSSDGNKSKRSGAARSLDAFSVANPRFRMTSVGQVIRGIAPNKFALEARGLCQSWKPATSTAFGCRHLATGHTTPSRAPREADATIFPKERGHATRKAALALAYVHCRPVISLSTQGCDFTKNLRSFRRSLSASRNVLRNPLPL